jgi:hypothetical protein
VLIRIVTACDGNPVYALEIAREVARTGGPAAAQPLPVQRRCRRSYGRDSIVCRGGRKRQWDGCAALWSDWMPDLAELYECHSDNPDGCLSDENPKFDMPATFSYHLTPVFKKVK